MGRKCGVAECLSDSNRSEDVGVTFHKIPLHPDIRPKWMSLCRIPEDKQTLKVVYICSRHFLRADFYNFKGKKYMLKQGVLPSVFPWNKCKVDKNAVHVKLEDDIKKEPDTDEKQLIDETLGISSDLNFTVKNENLDSLMIKEEVLSPGQSTTIEQKTKTIETPTGPLVFAPATRIEALDFNQSWCPAKIVEVDYEENEVLVHFEKYSSKYDEWISMNSSTLRALAPPVKKPPESEYVVGERCMAAWNDARKFPATIGRVIDADTYEVQFDDGYFKVLKTNRLAKSLGKPQASPLFEPVTGTKQERRDRKRKINVAALFGKRVRNSIQDDNKPSTSDSGLMSPSEEPDYWTPSWENGKPVGEKSVLETQDGPRKSTIVADPRIPAGWVKHLSQRVHGVSAGKWDTLIVSPEGRRFRTRSEIKVYIDDNPGQNLSESMFDFSIYRRSKSKRTSHIIEPPAPPIMENVPLEIKTEEEPADNHNSLKIQFIDHAYMCPIEGCGKNFRRENLAQMHVKHYHPEYTKFLDSTPNVADLAYARTVGESLDRSPGPDKSRVSTSRQIQKTTPKPPVIKHPQSPAIAEFEPKDSKAKDCEIIKLLNSKPFDSIKKEDSSQVQAIPSGLPPSMYPDIKLKDLLIKSEGIPKRDEINLKSLSTVRPSGIKTLLPVIRTQENKLEDAKQSFKRKRLPSEAPFDAPQEAELPIVVQEIKTEPNNLILEGGEIIKIVKMKLEEIINCTCGITEEDGLMIQCELCLCWQHAYCNNIERENQVPDKYICYICQNPIRQRLSKKFLYDQDWLKNGTLPTGSYHCKDEELLSKRFEKLKRSHDFTGGLTEMKDLLHTLKVKIKIAEANNHPKLYLWSKPWEKLSLPEEPYIKEEEDENMNVDSKCDGDSMLMSLLKTGRDDEKLKTELPEFPKLDLNTLMGNGMQLTAPIIPQPEAAIDSADCRLNLLEHIAHSQSLVERRLSDFEKQINLLEVGNVADEVDEDFPKMRQTVEMLMRDLGTLKDLAASSSI